MTKVLFAPVGIAGGLVAGLISKKLFDFAWARVSTTEPPEPENRDVSWPELVAALALQGAIFRVSRGIVERGSRIGFYRFTGAWPGEEKPDAS
jgi:Protein of unknown function (DUF4235)